MNKKEGFLIEASRLGLTKAVKALLEEGADASVERDYALEWASRNGHTEVVELLKQYSKRGKIK